MQFDYTYLCQGLGHLTGLETRVYKKNELFDRYSPMQFDPDVSGFIYQEAHKRQESTFYIETEELLLFGVVKSKRDNVMLIIGPTSQIRPRKEAEVSILCMLGESPDRLPELHAYFNNMVPYPFENFLEILCFVNYALNDEKCSVSDLIESNTFVTAVTPVPQQHAPDNLQNNPHNTYEAEKMMLSYVTSGNTAAIQTFFTQPPTGRAGALAHNELRQRKNIFVCAATLISRAAIAGGMPTDTAFALSDRYIQKAELLSSGGDIATLNMEMLLDYTKRVEALQCGGEDARLAKDVRHYILAHIGEKITTVHLAQALHISRAHLCERFRAETGRTLVEFINETKLGEAKRLFSISDLTIAQVSDHLGFSSQSYFQNVFKKQEGCTPKEYRSKMKAAQYAST